MNVVIPVIKTTRVGVSNWVVSADDSSVIARQNISGVNHGASSRKRDSIEPGDCRRSVRKVVEWIRTVVDRERRAVGSELLITLHALSFFSEWRNKNSRGDPFDCAGRNHGRSVLSPSLPWHQKLVSNVAQTSNLTMRERRTSSNTLINNLLTWPAFASVLKGRIANAAWSPSTDLVGRADEDLLILHVWLKALRPVNKPLIVATTWITSVVGHREVIIRIAKIQLHPNSDLLGVAQVCSLLCCGSGLCKNWEQNRCEDRDNRNHHEQFDEGKGFSGLHHPTIVP